MFIYHHQSESVCAHSHTIFRLVRAICNTIDIYTGCTTHTPPRSLVVMSKTPEKYTQLKDEKVFTAVAAVTRYLVYFRGHDLGLLVIGTYDTRKLAQAAVDRQMLHMLEEENYELDGNTLEDEFELMTRGEVHTEIVEVQHNRITPVSSDEWCAR